PCVRQASEDLNNLRHGKPVATAVSLAILRVGEGLIAHCSRCPKVRDLPQLKSRSHHEASTASSLTRGPTKPNCAAQPQPRQIEPNERAPAQLSTGRAEPELSFNRKGDPGALEAP